MINSKNLQEKIKELEGPVFVFGASGFIGVNVFNQILSVRNDCYAITHDAINAWRLKALNTPVSSIVHCDITSFISVKNIFEKYKPKTVFNLAAYGAYSKQNDVNLRLYSVYGPWEEPDRLVPVIIEKARQNTFPNLVQKEISRDFVFVTDAVEAFVDAALNVSLDVKGKSYNICTGKKTTLEELINLVKNEFGISQTAVWGNMENRAWDLKDWYGNPENSNKDLKWKAKTGLADGMRTTFEWHEKIGY